MSCRVAFGDSGGGEKSFLFLGAREAENAYLFSVPAEPRAQFENPYLADLSFVGLDSTSLAVGLVRRFWPRDWNWIQRPSRGFGGCAVFVCDCGMLGDAIVAVA